MFVGEAQLEIVDGQPFAEWVVSELDLLFVEGQVKE